MFEDILSRIKEKQERKYDEVSELLPEINNFHQHLIDNLYSFIELAKEKEIRGVEFHDQKENPNGVGEISFNIAENEYILVTNNNVEKLKPGSDNIGNHAFIYHDRNENSLPLLQISLIKYSDGRKYFSISWFPNEEKSHITGNRILEKDSGEEAAKSIIEFIYGIDFYLRDRPILEAFHMETSKNRKLGFLD